MKFVANILKSYMRHDGLDLSAVISFFAILSLIPLMLIMISVTGYVIGSQETLLAQLAEEALAVIPRGGKLIMNEIHGAIERRSSLGGIGIVILLFTASLLFSSLDKSLNTIFEHAKDRFFLHSKLLSFVLIFVLAAFMFLPAALKLITPAFTFFGFKAPIHTMTIGVISYVLAFLTFVVVIKILPACKVHIQHAVTGGVIFVILLWIAKVMFTLWIGEVFSNYSVVYGSLAALIVTVLWIFYVSNAFLISSEVVSALSMRKLVEEKRNRYL